MKVVLVTGVAGRIGRATARRFAGHGWSVIGVDIKATDAIGGVDIETADIANDAEVRTLVKGIGDTHGRLDAIINNAAVCVPRPLLETSVDEWDITMAVNVKASFLTIKYGLPLLARHAGSVVNVSSVHAVASAPNMAAFAASKGALVALTKAIAVELQPRGVRVNAVLPAMLDAGDAGVAEQIAAAIYFLADNTQSSFITGEALVVDGGTTARLGG